MAKKETERLIEKLRLNCFILSQLTGAGEGGSQTVTDGHRRFTDSSFVSHHRISRDPVPLPVYATWTFSRNVFSVISLMFASRSSALTLNYFNQTHSVVEKFCESISYDLFFFPNNKNMSLVSFANEKPVSAYFANRVKKQRQQGFVLQLLAI